VQGIQTTIPLHRLIVTDEEFQAGRFDTKFMERFLARRHQHTAEKTALGV
jgi:acetyl-CoA carboxylase, biotin carboxylase subunit